METIYPQQALLSPTYTSSPRKPLANLSTNTPISPSKPFADVKSPGRAGLVFLDPRETRGIKRPALDVLDASEGANKRWMGDGDVKHSQSSQVTGGSFSSLINYDPSSEANVASEGAESETSEERMSRERVDRLKATLKLAMYRVRTNQVNVPLDGLRIYEPLTAATASTHQQVEPEEEMDLPSTPRRSHHVEESDDDLPYEDDGDCQLDDLDLPAKKVAELTSSAVKGHAVTGLLELRRSGNLG